MVKVYLDVRATLAALLVSLLVGLGVGQPLHAQADKLAAGPMVGYAEMREALIWVQTKGAVTVQYEYWDKAQPQKHRRSETVTTKREEAFTAHIVLDSVQPGRQYQYELYLGGKRVPRPYPTEFSTPSMWRYRTEPPAFKLALGSCAFINDTAYDRPGPGYGGEYEIFEAIQAKKPDVMLWLGDNVYFRDADNSRTAMIYRYTHDRALPQMQALLAGRPNYAIWDDHDYGPNDSDGSYWLKDQALDVFKLFWGNQSYTQPGVPGNISTFSWGDAQVFLVDNRYNRTANDRIATEHTILGEAQLEWLINALASSPALFKFVAIGGQVLNSASLYENYAKLAPAERLRLIRAIEQEKIPGVIFLTGDRHHTELSRLKEGENLPIYDLTVSPLTSGPATNSKTEPNQNRVADTWVGQRNFGVLEFSGPRLDRQLKIVIYDVKGQELWSRTLSWKELNTAKAER